MKIEIKGYLPTSLIDYPGKICSVVFLPNCNFRCPYCQNPDLVLRPNELPSFNVEDVLTHMKNRKGWLDGVCITGGEPTLHADLPKFIEKIKELGLLVKLDTNGTNPKMLKELIDRKLIDYVAMDVKAPLDEYEKVVRVNVDKNMLRESINLIRNSGIDYEFRITVVPDFTGKKEIEKIGKLLEGSKRFCIQQFRSLRTLDESYQKKKPYNPDELKELAEVAKPFFKEVCVRGI